MEAANNMLPSLTVPRAMVLPDTDQWRFRFQIPSESSDRLYTIAQNKKGKFWGCDCPGWRVHRNCKHLTAMGLPNYQQPYDVNLITQ